MNQDMTGQTLRQQNRKFAGTAGVSDNNRSECYVPAFRDTTTGRAEPARFSNGTPSPFHILDGVPAEWVTRRDSGGRVIAVRKSIEAGFLRKGRFYTRQQAAEAVH